ncbi:MAG: acid phosphatase [Gammaproteobacteria bacterium]|nr:acid phosphatase [Gammaproteobacteria bacterium]
MGRAMRKNLLVGLSMCVVLANISPVLIAQQNNLAYAVAWKQTAAEHTALYHQGFNIARMQLEIAIAKRSEFENPLAIISDVDETLLLSKSYWGYMLASGYDFFDDAEWDAWVGEDLFTPSPGSIEFAEFCRQNDVDIFYVTNRNQGETTFDLARKNLETAGFGKVETNHLIVLRDTSNKEVIQQQIMQDFEVIVLLGDNLNDFSRDYYVTDVEQRRSLVSEKRKGFGVRNIIFPNPTDGHWLRAIYGDSEPPASSINREILHAAASSAAWQKAKK